MTDKEMVYLGDFSATPSQYSRHMECYDCSVSWTGCWDNFQCPKCGEGELPSCRLPGTCAYCGRIGSSDCTTCDQQ